MAIPPLPHGVGPNPDQGESLRTNHTLGKVRPIAAVRLSDRSTAGVIVDQSLSGVRQRHMLGQSGLLFSVLQRLLLVKTLSVDDFNIGFLAVIFYRYRPVILNV